MYVGGIVGKATASPAGNDSGAYIEESKVGKLYIPYLDTPIQDARQVVIEGYQNVGGVVGYVDGVSVRGFQEVDVKVDSSGLAGGIIGYTNLTSSNHMEFMGYNSKVEFNPKSNPTNYLGGLVGKINQSVSNQTYYMASNLADVTFSSTTNAVNYFGGLVGNYYSSSNAGLKIYNSKANLNVDVDGDYQGGLVGAYAATNVMSGYDPQANNELPAVAYSVAQGYLGTVGTSGLYRGGFIGLSIDSDVVRSIANIEVYGTNYLGGLFGKTTDSIVFENYIDIYLESDTTGGSNSSFVGGVVGELVSSSNQFHRFFQLSKVKADIDYTGINVASCGSVGCGLVVGNLNSNHSSAITYGSIAMGSVTDMSAGSPSDSSFTCGTQYGSGACPTNLGGSTDVALQQGETNSNCAPLIAAGAPFYSDGTTCFNLFEYQWADYGYDTNVSDVRYAYLAGNHIEPFALTSVADWDNLSADSFLMAKSFELQNDIDFGGVAPNPIGSPNAPFKGSIFSNGWSLRNIDFTATAAAKGIFSHVQGGAMFGNWQKPLIIDGLDIDCNTQSGCGFIGELIPAYFGGSDTQISMQIKSGNISGSGSCYGGMIGDASAPVRIEKSFYSGTISSSSSLSSGIGGFIGCITDPGSGGSSYLGFDIDSSFADLESISGGTNVGGFIGEVGYTSVSNNVEIRRSYVVFDKDSLNSGNAIQAINATNTAGLVGGVDLNANSRFEIKDVYIDTSTAQIPSYYSHVANSTSGTVDGNNDRFENVALIWGTGSASTYVGIEGGSAISFIATSAKNLADNGSDFDTCTDGRCEWWLDPNQTTPRLLQFWWENPNNPWQ